MHYQTVLDFWFTELTPEDWFKKSDALDERIAEKFKKAHQQANAGELFAWRSSVKGRLAEVIVLDQFSRNIFRNKPQSFASDKQALTLAQEIVLLKFDVELNQQERFFAYLPYMHSESLLVHDEALRLFEQLDEKSGLEFEIKHRDIIERFGRYPHRNEILGRKSTPEELEFLATPNSSF